MKSYVDIPVADKEKAIARLRLITQKEPPKVTWADGVCRPSDPSVAFHGWISDQRVYVTPIIPGYKNFSAPINGEFIHISYKILLLSFRSFNNIISSVNA